MVNIICGYNDVLGPITKVPSVCDIWAAVVVGMKYVDHAHHGPLTARSLLSIQPDLDARQRLNDLYNHRVGRRHAQPITSRNCCRIASQSHKDS